MKNLSLIVLISFFSIKLHSQGIKITPKEFPSEFGVFTFPLGSKILLELKEVADNKFEYKVLNIEPVKGFYSFGKNEDLFSKKIKKNTVELFFMGAFYNDGKSDEDYKTLLMLKNYSDIPIIYKADIKYYFKNDYENTSTTGLLPKVKTTEIWQHKVDYITLYNFEKQK